MGKKFTLRGNVWFPQPAAERSATVHCPSVHMFPTVGPLFVKLSCTVGTLDEPLPTDRELTLGSLIQRAVLHPSFKSLGFSRLQEMRTESERSKTIVCVCVCMLAGARGVEGRGV